jgi:hypothetical protein
LQKVALFLASDASSFIRGAETFADGARRRFESIGSGRLF